MEQIMKFMPYIIGIIIAVVYAIYVAKTEPQKVKQWLLYACAQAEAYFGSGTGILKLHMVYDMFVGKYPVFSKFISFNRFQKWTEEALETFKEFLSKNEKMQALFIEEQEVALDEEKD